MPESLFDLLSEPLIGVREENDSESRVSLPQLFARLARGDATEYAAIQVHQQSPWHCFLVQLAAIALHLEEATEPPNDATTWKKILIALTDGRSEPWCLVVEDLSHPAFLQPPVPEGSLSGFRDQLPGPDHDKVDLLLTARNHDVKSARVHHAEPQHWIYTLVTLQTQQGFSGRMNYGIARMNGGFASRPCVTFAPNHNWSDRFRRDLQILLADRARVVEQLEYPTQNGEALLWLMPWDGDTSLSLHMCDPYFIEICRRVRLQIEKGAISAFCTPSRQPRIDAGESKGHTGDPWTPIRTADAAALTVSASGFSYRLVTRLLLTGDFQPGRALVLRVEDGESPLFLASVLVRGQGKTEGYHTRVIPVPKLTRGFLMSSDGRTRLRKVAEARIDTVDTVQRRVFKPALCALLQADPEQLKLDDPRTEPYLDALDDAVDRVFFDHLWNSLGQDSEKTETAWKTFVLDLAEQELERAIKISPLPAARRYRVISAAERWFHGLVRKHFSEIFELEEETAK